MKTTKILLISLLAVIATLSSCRKDEIDLLRPDEMLSYTTPSQQFNSIWCSMNQSYVFWDIDPTDWDAVYDEYYPKFKELDKQEYVATKDLEALYSGAFKTIIDHHLLIEVFNKWADPNDSDDPGKLAFSPGNNEIQTRDYYHDCYGYGVWFATSQLSKLVEQGANITDFQKGWDGENFYFATALINDETVYVGFSGFNIFTSLPQAEEIVNAGEPEDEESEEYEIYERSKNLVDAFNTYKDNILYNPNVKNAIIDVRGNGGGYLVDEYFILGLMVDQPILAGYSRLKQGLGKYDYTPWLPHFFYPNEECRRLEGKIVLLADLYSVSMAEMTTLLVKNLPNGYVIGERTFGGQGVLEGDFSENYTGTFGSREGPHFGYLCDRCVKTVDGKVLEGIGASPDIAMSYNLEEIVDDNDSWLMRAIEYISTGK